MSILNEIVDKKRERLEFARLRLSLQDVRRMADDSEPPRDFTSAVKRRSGESIKLIAEIKKASPSKGIIKKDFDHISIAGAYEKKHVNAVSVLTEEDFFKGSLQFIPEVKQVLTKPALRKDFIFDEYQIFEARAYEADAVLLIAAILETNQAAEYLHLSKELGLSVLFEIHNFSELEMALSINAGIIGINNRNLKTMKIDIQTTFDLKKEITDDTVVVSESGIKTREDVKRLEDAGIDSLLIGTAFMEAGDIGKKIDELMGKA